MSITYYWRMESFPIFRSQTVLISTSNVKAVKFEMSVHCKLVGKSIYLN